MAGTIEKEGVMISEGLSSKEIRTLQRLPSVAKRGLEINGLVERNEVLVIRDVRERILLVTFYHNFGNFVYTHGTVGKDGYKDLLGYYLFKRTTKLAPTYCILFNSKASIEFAEKYGAEEIDLGRIPIPMDDFINKINSVTDSQFYSDGEVLRDRLDNDPVQNPLFVVSKKSYDLSVEGRGFNNDRFWVITQ